jgi:hypothetical protein
MGNTTLIPARVPVSDRGSLKGALKRDGIVIVTDLPMDEHSPGCWESIAGELPVLCFGETNLPPGEPPVVAVHHEFARFEQLQTLEVTHGDEGAVLSKAVEDKLLAKSEREGLPHFTEIPWQRGLRQNPHTDGYVYGDHVPDYIFLLVERQADAGGDSFFVDGEAVLARLRAEPDADNFIPLLDTLIFDQTESAENGGMLQGRQCKGPLFVRRPDGRLQWKRMLGKDQLQTIEEMQSVPIPRSCWGVTSETRRMAAELGAKITPEEVLRRTDLAIQAESDIAQRVPLAKGEAVCVDNYRILHSREAFDTGERRLWRVWTWTTGSDGRPNGDERPVSTPLDIHLELTGAQTSQ